MPRLTSVPVIRATRPLFLVGAAALLAATAGITQSSRAEAATSAPIVKAPVCGKYTGWSSAAPAKCGTVAASKVTSESKVAPESDAAPSATAAWSNDVGCKGYYTGDDPKEMQCRGVAVTVHNLQVPIRVGYWTGTGGFGWSKAYYYHNLWMQPMLDTIHSAADPKGSNSSRDYEVYHYDDGELDQEVVVVADIQDGYFAGVSTQDGYILGVLTGYCNNGAGSEETTCPGWVDDTL